MSQASFSTFVSSHGSSHNSTSTPFLMAALSSSDLFVIVVGVVLGGVYLFKDTLFAPKVKEAPIAVRSAESSSDSRDFVAKLKETVSVTPQFLVLSRPFLMPRPPEKAHCYLLWVSNRNGRGIRNSTRKGGKVKVWSWESCMRCRRVRFRKPRSSPRGLCRLLRDGNVR